MGYEVFYPRRTERPWAIVGMLLEMATTTVDSTVHLFRRVAIAWTLREILRGLGVEDLCGKLPSGSERELAVEEMRAIAECAVKYAVRVVNSMMVETR